MYQVTLTQTFCVMCDRCGKSASTPIDDTTKAAEKALESGFKRSEYFTGKCYRESWLCKDCYDNLWYDLSKPNLLSDDGLSRLEERVKGAYQSNTSAFVVGDVERLIKEIKTIRKLLLG